MDLPPRSEQLEPKPAPEPLQQVQALVNTVDIGLGTDLLVNPETARAWLAREGLRGGRARLETAELAAIRDIRESLRALLAHNGGGPAPSATDLRPLRELTSEGRLKLSIEAPDRFSLGLAANPNTPERFLGLLVAIRDAQADGTWSRLKVCSNPDCRWAFFDRSRNRQGSWCAMAVCGNRLKNRQFRARRR